MIASNILCNSVSRFLGQAYFTDISVSGTASLASLSATGDITAGGNLYSTTGNLYLKNLLAINGQSDTWLRINANNAFTSGIYFGTSIVRTDGTLQVGSSGAYLKSNSTNTTIANLVAPIATITTGAITTLTASDVNANNVSVANNLHATHFDLQTVAQLGGSFYVSPTVKFPNSGTTLGVAKSGTTLTLTITDSSITSTTMAGIVWTANSRVKVSGTINGVVTGTMDGTVSSINTNSHVLTLSVSGENSGSVVAGTYSASQFSDLSVMVYQRRVVDGSTNYDYRVGIWMNCYDLETNLTSIRLYGGTTAKPSVMIGNLNQANLDAIGGITPSGWSLYADGAFLKGAIVSTEGQIGGWTIGSTKLYNNTDSLTSQAVGIYLGTDGIRNFASTSQYVNITGGKITALGVDVSGKITATSGAIGGFEINSTAIKTLNVAVTSNADNSISLSSADFTRTINSTSRAGLRFAIGDKFGVTGDGVIYAGSAIISGTLTAGADSKIGPWTVTATSIYKTNATMGNATAGAAYFGDNGLSVTDKFQVTAAGALTATSATVTGTIKADTGYIGGSSGFTITSGKIYSSTHSAYNTAVAGVYIGTDYISLGSGGVTYFKSDGTGKIGPWTLTATSLYKGNATLGTSGNSNIYLGDNGLSLSNKFVYKTSDGSLSLNVSSLSISGTSVPTTTSMNTAIANAAAAAAGTATNYIYYDADYGLVLSQTGTASTGYNMRLTSTGIEMRRMENVYASYGATIVLGQEGGNHISIDSNGFNLLKGTNTLVSYGSTTTFYHGVNGRKAITLDQNYGLRFYDNTSANNTVAQLNGSGLVVSTGYIGGTSGWTIASQQLSSGSLAASNSMVLATKDLGSNTSIAGRSGSDWRFAIDSNFGITKTGAVYASTLVIGPSNGYHATVADSAFKVYNNTTLLSSFGATTTIGRTDSTNRNIYIDANSVSIRSGTTVLSSFATDITLGRVASGYRNILIDPNGGVSIRDNTTTIANFSNTITLGDLSSKYGSSIVLSGAQFNVALGQKPFFYVGAKRDQTIEDDGLVQTLYEFGDLDIYTYYYYIDGEKYYYIDTIPQYAIVIEVENDGALVPFVENTNSNNTKYIYAKLTSGSCSLSYFSYGPIYLSFGINDYTNNTPGIFSSTFGSGCVSSGDYSSTIGIDCTASGKYSISCGRKCVASGNESFATGYYSRATDICSIAMGNHVYSTSSGCLTIGKYNEVTSTTSNGTTSYDAGDYAFIIGNGDDPGSSGVVRSNALTVDWNGVVKAANIGNIQSASKSVAITSSNTIGATPAIGAQLTLTPGTYLLWGRFVFSTSGSGTTRNNRIAFYTGASPTDSTMLSESQVCVFTAARDWGALTTTYIVSPTENTTYTVGGTSSLPGPDGGMSVIKAIRLL